MLKQLSPSCNVIFFLPEHFSKLMVTVFPAMPLGGADVVYN